MREKDLPLILWIFFAYANRVHSQCTSNNDCAMASAVCQNSECACPGNYVPNSYYTKCLQVGRNFGDVCEDNLQCSTGFSTGGSCNNGTCACLDEYHYFKGKCWKTSALGEKCQRDENCFVSDDFEAAVCTSGKVCACAEGYYQREYTSCRKKRTQPGEPCGITPDCQFDGGYCDSTRTCSNSSSLSLQEPKLNTGDGLFLSPVSLTSALLQSSVGPHSSCSKNSDCPQHSTCSSGICLCDSGFYPDDSGCHPELGSACQQDSDCLGKNTECSSDKKYCTCKNGFAMSNNRQFCDKLSRKLGWSCLTDVWCSYFGPKSVCSKKKCVCGDNSRYVEKEMFCWIQLKVGDKCHADLDCGDTGSATCSGAGICSCPSGTHPSSDKLTCRSNAKLNETCVEDVDCIVSNSECKSGNNTCACKEGYLVSQGSCVPGITGSCQFGVECFVNSSTCVQGQCSCNNNLVPSQNLDSCLPPVEINQNCTETAQCSHLDAECLNGQCLCSNGSHFVTGWSCFKSVELTQACTKQDECYVANSECSSFKCSCVYGYTAVDGQCSGSISHFNFTNSALVVFLLFLIKIV